MRALITGVTGFAGGFLAEHLLASGDQVLGCSRHGQWPDWAGDELRTRVSLLRWDVVQAELNAGVRAELAAFSPDCVYHLAALSVPSDCGTIDPTQQAIDVNVRGTERVVELAAGLSTRPRVVFISTSHVYARTPTQCTTIDESAPTDPQRGYGKTKLMAEEAVRRAAASGLDAVIVRAFQHTGPRQEPRLMLPEWAIQAVRPVDEPIRVKHLDTWIDLTDVRDVVRAYRLLAERAERGSIYNVGSGIPVRTGDILRLLLKLSGSSRNIVELQPGPERFDPIADIRRLQAATGWRPNVTLDQTVADSLQYWSELMGRSCQGGSQGGG